MKKRGLRLSIEIVLLISLITASCVVFLNNYLLPVKLKALLETSLTNAFQRPATLKELSFDIAEGLIVDQLVVFEDQSRIEVFLKANQLKFKPLFLPLLLRKEIIITPVTLKQLYIQLKRGEQGQFNILNPPVFATKAKTQQKFSVILTNLKALNASITFKDAFLAEEEINVFEQVNLRVDFSLPAKVDFNLTGRLKDKAKSISLAGAYYFTNKSLKANLNCVDLNLHKLPAYFKDKVPLLIEREQTDIDLEIELDADKKMDFEGIFYFNQVRASFKPLTLDGNLAIKAKGAYDLKNNILTEAKGNIGLEDNALEGVYYITKLENLKGNIAFDKEGLSITDVSGTTNGLALTFAGYLKDFANPQFELTVKTDSKVQQILEQLPPQFSEKLKDIQLEGTAGVRLNFKGAFKQDWTIDFSGSSALKGATFKSSKPAVEIKDIAAQLHFTKDKLIIDNLTMKLKDAAYSANATVNDFSQPSVNFKLSSANLAAAGKVKMPADRLLLEEITGTYKGVNFAASGEVSSLVEPVLNINAKLNSELAVLENLLPNSKEILHKLKLNGAIYSDLYFSGKAAEPFSGLAKVKCTSEQIRVGELKINDISLSGQLKQNQLLIEELSGKFYNGSLKIDALGNLEDLKNPQFQMSLDLSAVDLSELAKDTKLQNKNIKGVGALKYTLQGQLNNPYSFVGTGSLQILDGYLWQAPIFNKLAVFLNISELRNVVFNKAFADYRIQNRYIATQNLTLLSDNVAMVASGSLGFDRSLDFLIQTEFAENFYESLVDKGKTAPIFLEALSRYALNIRLTGRLEEPQFKIKPIAVQKILKDGLIKGLEKILK